MTLNLLGANNFIKLVAYSVAKNKKIGLIKYTASNWGKKIYDII